MFLVYFSTIVPLVLTGTVAFYLGLTTKAPSLNKENQEPPGPALSKDWATQFTRLFLLL